MAIYKNTTPPPITLIESDADAFLRDIGVTLYEDTIMIDGTVYEGAYGEEILAENGIFLYEDGIVLEGQYKDAFDDWNRDRKGRKYDKQMRLLDKSHQKLLYKAERAKKHLADNLSRAEKSGNKDHMIRVKNITDKYNGRINDSVRRSHMRTKNAIDELAQKKRKFYGETASIFSDIEII